MKGYWEAKLAENLALTPGSNYEIEYEYDSNGRVSAEKVTGSITRTTTYGYDSDDNIVTETVEAEGMTITKTYTYTSGNITGVTVKIV